MTRNLLQLLNKLEHSIALQTVHARPYAIVLGWLGVFAHPLWYFYWAYCVHPINNMVVYESIGFRTVGLFSMLVLGFINKLPSPLKNYSSIIYFFIIVYNFPFFETLYLLQKSVNDPSLISYQMTLAATLVIFALLTNVMLYILGLIIGIASAILIYIFINLNPVFPQDLYAIIDVGIYCVIFGGIFTFNNKLYRDRIAQSMTLTCNKIFHEIKTPLLGITLMVETILRHLNSDQIEKNKVIKYANKIRKLSLDIKYLIEIISNNIRSTSNRNFNQDKERFFVAQATRNAIAHYPFSSDYDLKSVFERLDYDFAVNMISILFQNIIFNLIKNALTEINKRGYGKLEITSHKDNEYNILKFESTCGPIRIESKNRIFNPGYSTSEGHLGLGLNFCKEIMNDFGGKITCEDSKESAIFELHFPMSMEE